MAEAGGLLALSVEQIGKAINDATEIATEVADEHPEAAQLILAACRMATEELLARSFGGNAEARNYARRITRQRDRSSH